MSTGEEERPFVQMRPEAAISQHPGREMMLQVWWESHLSWKQPARTRACTVEPSRGNRTSKIKESGGEQNTVLRA